MARLVIEWCNVIITIQTKYSNLENLLCCLFLEGSHPCHWGALWAQAQAHSWPWMRPGPINGPDQTRAASPASCGQGRVWRGSLAQGQGPGDRGTSHTRLSGCLGHFTHEAIRAFHFDYLQILFYLFRMTDVQNTKKIVLSRCCLLLNMTNVIRFSYY